LSLSQIVIIEPIIIFGTIIFFETSFWKKYHFGEKMSTKEIQVKVLYNACKGGFNISEKAENEIMKRWTLEQNIIHKLFEIKSLYNLRMDSTVVAVFEMMDENNNSKEFSKNSSYIECETFSFLNHDPNNGNAWWDWFELTIDKYDGFETPFFKEIPSLFENRIQLILQNTSLTDSQKVFGISNLISSRPRLNVD